MHDLVISEVGPPIPLVFQHIYAKLSANLRGFSAEENRPCLTECSLLCNYLIPRVMMLEGQVKHEVIREKGV